MRRSTWAACVAVILATSPVFGQPRSSDPKRDAQSAARTRAEEGLARFKDGRWDDAYAAFAEADAMFHAPTLVAYMGTCRRNQGRLIEAKALYDKVLAEPVPPNAPEAFKKAIETARSEVEKLRVRVPLVKVRLAGPGAEQAAVTVDGVAMSALELTSGKLLDPGEHQIAADAPGASATAKVALKEGDAPIVELRLTPSATVEPTTPRAPAAEDKPRGSWLPAGVAFGVGGAGLVAGAVMGVVTLGKVSSAHEGCTPPDASGARHCPPGNASAASAARGLGIGSGVAFGVGAAGIVTGVVLAIVRPGGASPAASNVGVDVGPGSITFRGRF